MAVRLVEVTVKIKIFYSVLIEEGGRAAERERRSELKKKDRNFCGN